MKTKREIQEHGRRMGNCLIEAAVGTALLLCTAGCSDWVRTPTPQEQAAFEEAGSITPVVDMDRIEKAKLAKGPYRVVPGDVLEFTMPTLLQAVTAAEVQAAQIRNPTVNPYLAPYLVRVRDSGSIVLPTVGPIPVAGLSLAQIEEQVTEVYKSSIVPYPSVFVRVAEYKTAQVYIAGAVKTPGVYPLRADQMTLSHLLTQAGGISEAGAAVVRLVRSASRPPAAGDLPARLIPVRAGADGNDPAPQDGARAQEVEKIRAEEEQPTADSTAAPPPSVARAVATPDLDPGPPSRTEPKAIVLPVVNTNIPYRDIALAEGETVVVEPVQMPVFSVLGLVARPGNFPYPPNAQYNLAQAIAFAGGLDPVAEPWYATVYRLGPDGTVARAPFRLIRNDHLTAAAGTPIRPGDVVAIENTPRTRFNTIVRELFRFNAGIYITGRDLGITQD
jgi:protein involved in polysaccharide export with SLBB domain